MIFFKGITSKRTFSAFALNDKKIWKLILLKAILLQVMAGLKLASPSHSDQNKHWPAVSAHLKIQQLWKIWPQCNFKACVCYFSSNFYFSPNDSPSKFISSRKLFSFLRYLIAIFLSSPLLFPVSHFFREWFKKNLKVYDVIICLNKNLITLFVWYLQKEIRCDIETLSIDSILNMEHFYVKVMQKMCTKSYPQTPF